VRLWKTGLAAKAMPENKSYSRSTHLAVGGRSGDVTRGAVNPPVVHASTFLFDSLGEMLRISANPTDRSDQYYGSTGTATSRALEDAITLIDGGAGCVLFPSGLSAVASALLSFLEKGDHLLMVDSCYGPTRVFCDDRLSAFGIETTYYDPMIGAGISSLIRPNTRCIFLESPGSITFEIQDIPAICEVARNAGLITLMDNTWATSLYFDAFAHGADISIQAGTKYLSGHADVMMGMVSAQDSIHLQQVRELAFDMGLLAAPDDCYLILRGIRTLELRLEKHHANALKLARWLQDVPTVQRVLYPALPDCPGHEFWKRDFQGASGLFSVVIDPVNTEQLGAMLDHMQLFGMGYSWGGFESLMIPMDTESLRCASDCSVGGTLLRIHVGLEDPDDLIRDLDAGFERMRLAGAGIPGDIDQGPDD
jgi:cystathionine beta-lyase